MRNTKEYDAERWKRVGEIIKAEKREKRKSDPVFAEKQREYVRKYRLTNLESERKRDRENKTKKRELNREAHNAYMREWNEKNKDRINAERRDRRKNDIVYREKLRQKGKDKYARLVKKIRNSRLNKAYGINQSDYEEMYQSQQGKCAICGTEKKMGSRTGLVIDHCHNKGHIRGLLCSHCNTGLGQFRDDTGLLQKAIDYLTRR